LRLNSTCHRHRKKFKHNNMSALRWQMHKSTKHRIAWLMSFWALFMLLGWCSRKTIHQIVQHIYMLVQCVWQHIWIQFGTLHTIVTRHLSCEFFKKKLWWLRLCNFSMILHCNFHLNYNQFQLIRNIVSKHV